jgi:somatomedin B domain-containing protein
MGKLAPAFSFIAACSWLLCGASEAAAAGSGSCADSDCVNPGSDCHCDGGCTTYGDCCGDYAAVCGPALGPALDAASAADIFVTRSSEEVSQSIIPGFFTHSGLKDYSGDNWFHSTGSLDNGILDCPLGLYGGVKYEARPSEGEAGSAVFHVTNVSDTQRGAAADMAYNHYLAHYPFREDSGTAWSGDAEETGTGAPDYCSSESSAFRANYDWSWIDTRVNDHAYCSALVYWSYSSASVDACGTTLSGAGFDKPLYDHSADFGPKCTWLGERFNDLEGDVCDAAGGLEGWDVTGHFLGWVQGSHEPDENQAENQCRAGVSGVEAITPSELVENHVDEGYTEGYFTFSYAYGGASSQDPVE